MEALVIPLDAVLFDLDGTLVDTHINFALMKREMIVLAVSAGLFDDELVGLDILGIAKAAAARINETRGRQHGDDLYKRAMGILEDIELQHARNTELVPYASEAVDLLRRHGVRIGIVTRNCRKASELSLRIAGIVPDTLICREDSINHKPHPEPILLALEHLNAEPGNSVMIGDHIMDVQSGKAAGLKTVGFLRDDRPDDFFDSVQPDLVTRSLKEAMSAIINSDRQLEH